MRKSFRVNAALCAAVLSSSVSLPVLAKHPTPNPHGVSGVVRKDKNGWAATLVSPEPIFNTWPGYVLSASAQPKNNESVGINYPPSNGGSFTTADSGLPMGNFQGTEVWYQTDSSATPGQNVDGGLKLVVQTTDGYYHEATQQSQPFFSGIVFCADFSNARGIPADPHVFIYSCGSTEFAPPIVSVPAAKAAVVFTGTSDCQKITSSFMRINGDSQDSNVYDGQLDSCGMVFSSVVDKKYNFEINGGDDGNDS